MAMAPDEELIAEATRRLAAAAPNAKVILFGSHSRGDARPDSDLDLFVIEPEVKSRRAEFVRLREALGNRGVPVGLVVVPAFHVEEWGHFEGTMVKSGCGKVVSSPRREPADLTSLLLLLERGSAGPRSPVAGSPVGSSSPRRRKPDARPDKDRRRCE
jgi:predicted nucleotidyltransferase